MFGFGKKKKKKAEEMKVAPKVVKEEPKVVVEEPKEVKEDVKKVEPATKKEPQSKAKPKPKKQSYHITKHTSGGWQIKKGKAVRALKRFKTQKEAIEYAESLADSAGSSIVIHKMDGSIRKQDYKKKS